MAARISDTKTGSRNPPPGCSSALAECCLPLACGPAGSKLGPTTVQGSPPERRQCLTFSRPCSRTLPRLLGFGEFSEPTAHGALDRGSPQKKVEKIFDLMEQFAGYGFNKSHSAAYALLAYH